MLRMKISWLFPLLALAFAGCGGAIPAAGGAIPAATTSDTAAPSTPSGFTATVASATKVNLSWIASTDNIGVKGYSIRRNGVQVGTSATINFADTGVAGSTTYSYTVAAFDAAGNFSPNSSSQSVTTPIASTDNTPPSVPTNLVATPGSGAVSLTWTASTDNVGVTGYLILRNGSQIGITTTTSYTDSCLPGSTPFTYTVSAFDAAGNTSAQTGSAGATTLASGAPSALAQLAASMNSGTWSSTFTMGGLDLPLVTAGGQSVPSFMLFAARGSWDCGHRKLQFAGTSHTGGAFILNAGALITWDDATNQWTKESYTWSSEDPGHSYYHVTMNTNGDLYFRKFNSGIIYRRSFGSTGQTSWQTGQVADQPQRANQVAGGLEWYRQLNGGTGGLVFVDAAGASWSNAALTSWSSTPTLLSGNYQNWSAAAGGFIYWGGGSVVNQTVMYRLSPTGSATRMPDSPLAAGVNSDSAIVLPHPNGTDLLLFGTGAGGVIYQFNGSTWSGNIGPHQIGSDFWVGFTIPDYGVIVFVRHPGGTGTPNAVVYKP